MSSFIKPNVRWQHFSLTEENVVSSLCQPVGESTRFVTCHFYNVVCDKLLLLVFTGNLCEQHQQHSAVACDSLATLWFVHSFIHSFMLFFVLQQAHKFASWCFLFQFPASFFLTPSSSFLRLPPRLPVTPILQSVFPLIMCFRRQYLRKVGPIHLASLPCILCRIFLYCLTLCNKS
jgi:hypothetical protein